MTRKVSIELLTTPGCGLCDEMKDVLHRALRGLAADVREVDISQDPELEKRYGLDIPVLFIDGEKAFEHRVTEKELRHRLRAAAAS